ncbi:hypothetical protein ACNOYE_14880 [Nannocystaceae bacterium ST9]
MLASRPVRLAAPALVLALALPTPTFALAHHVPGHGSSEGVRSINSLGGRGGAASSRLMLLDEFSHNGGGLVPGQRNDLSLLGEYAPVRAFSFGAQLPFTLIAEQPIDGPDRVRAGYGDTRVFARVTPFARKLIHRTLTLGVAASFPTRTVHGSVDPGHVWSVTPSLIFTRTYDKLFWQLLTFASTEWRPSGVALDLSAGGQVGGRLAKNKLAIGAGALLDVRTVNACRSPQGELDYCAGSRAGEKDRGVGSLRGTALATFAWNFHQAKTASYALNLSAQIPITPKRDFDVGASFGLQVVF